MAEHEVTLGEVYRLIVSMDKRLDAGLSKVIGRDEYEADQDGIVAKFQQSEKVHTQLDARVAEVNAARKVAVTEEATEREKGDARLETRIDRIGGWVKWGGGTVLSLVIAVIGWMLANGGGP